MPHARPLLLDVDVTASPPRLACETFVAHDLRPIHRAQLAEELSLLSLQATSRVY